MTVKVPCKPAGICAIVFFMIITQVQSQNQANMNEYQTITLINAVSYAMANNPDLKTQAILLEDARRKNANSWNVFLPSLSLNGGVSNTHIASAAANGWNWNAAAGISIGFSAAVPAQMTQFALEYQAAQLAYSKLESEIITQVSVAFYRLLAEKENIAILQDSLMLSRQQYEQVTANYKNGLASELEMLKAQYAWLAAGPALESAVSSYQANLAIFMLLIGENTAVQPEGTISPKELTLIPAEKLADTYTENRFDVRQKKTALEQAQLAKTILSLNTFAPSLSLGESVRLSPQSQGVFVSPAAVSGTFSISLSIPLDALIPGSKSSLEVKTAQGTIENAQTALDAAAKSAAKDIETKAAEIDRLWQVIAVSRLNTQIAERAYELSREGYAAGLVTQTDLESARQQMTSARQALTQAQAEYLCAAYNLANALQISITDLYKSFGGDSAKTGESI